MEGLTIDLFEPGMGPLHRAGLGGLAATIRWLNDPERGGRLDSALRPSGILDYDKTSVTISWGEPRQAGDFLRKLYELAFDLKDGLIHLPGSYRANPPDSEVKAALQAGMSQTILQFGPNRKASGPAKTGQYEVDGKLIRFQHQNITSYTHRSAWKDLVTPKGTLKENVKISGTIAPGFVQRHVAFPATTIEQPPGHAIALHFALVGTLSLSLGAKGGALIVPEVEDLEFFARSRGWLTPETPKDCRLGGSADAALQAMVRLRAESGRELLEVQRCLAVLFTSQSWNEKQKTRAAVLDVDDDAKTLERFDTAMKELPPRVATAKTDKGDGEKSEGFWADSVVRPLIADNLATGRPWFENFRSLIVGPDGKTDESRVRILNYERKGLQVMTDKSLDHEAEKKLVEAIHVAMGRRFSLIGDETNYNHETGANKDAYWNRRNRQMQQWRLELAQARTADDVRGALAKMWSRSVASTSDKSDRLKRSTSNKILKEHWTVILSLFCDEDGKDRWKLNRDLALLALASYGGGKVKDETQTDNAAPADDDIDDQI